jgi:hypothetical protein
VDPFWELPLCFDIVDSFLGTGFQLLATAIGCQRTHGYFTAGWGFAVLLGLSGQILKHRGHRGAQGKAAVRLPFHVFREHFLGVDGYEDATAAGQDFSFFVDDFC